MPLPVAALFVDTAVDALFLFGRWAVLIAAIFIAVYLFLRRQFRKGKLQRYNWR